MATRHHATMEVGGWVLLAAALIWLLYLLFNKDGVSAGTVVSATLGGNPTGPPTITLDDPTKPAVYTTPDGTVWNWDPVGQQWTPSGLKIPFSSAPPLITGRMMTL